MTMSSKTKLCHGLLEVIEMQDDMIKKQNEIMISLVNENLEKENMINVLMQKEEYLY